MKKYQIHCINTLGYSSLVIVILLIKVINISLLILLVGYLLLSNLVFQYITVYNSLNHIKRFRMPQNLALN